MRTEKELEKEIEIHKKNPNNPKLNGKTCCKKAKLQVYKEWEQREKEIKDAVENLKTRNIDDIGLDVETEEYWVNYKELLNSLGEKK